MILNIIRKLNNFVGCNLAGRISIEKRFKSREVYNYIDLYMLTK